jgi:histidinol dehydrogenase
MPRHIKKAALAGQQEEVDAKIRGTVESIIADVAERGDAAVRELSERFDKWSPPRFRLSREEIEDLVAKVAPQTIDDIKFAQAQIRNFAEIQRASLKDVEVETLPGVVLGHRHIPVGSVGCYVPGGRPETNVSYGDKVIGTNHTLPTKGAARYTGGLWVGKFLKTCTYQEVRTPEASAMIGEYCSRLCAIERFWGHKEQADLRVRRYARWNAAE